jgi:hypothetical protein
MEVSYNYFKLINYIRFATSLRNERKKEPVPPPGLYKLPEYTTAGPTYIIPKYFEKGDKR